MSDIRPFEAGDAATVAAMYQRTFRNVRANPPPGLAAYLRHLFIESPFCDPDIASLVHCDDARRINGFIGVNVLPMTFEGARLRAAVCGSLMVEQARRDPIAGARLLRRALSGPQELSISETANNVSRQMWGHLRGIALAPYSLDWVRIIRPAAFALGAVSSRFPAVRLFSGLARGIDRLARRGIGQDRLQLLSVVPGARPPRGYRIEEVGADDFAGLVETLVRHYPLRPDWKPDQLAYVIAEAREKSDYGEPVLMAVRTRGGKRIGGFFYHVRPGGIARVLQILALPGNVEPVFDCLVADAEARGAAGLRGRTQPGLVEAMLARRVVFLNVSATIVQSRNSRIIEAFRNADGFFNGLAGEQWIRLFGGRFE